MAREIKPYIIELANETARKIESIAKKLPSRKDEILLYSKAVLNCKRLYEEGHVDDMDAVREIVNLWDEL